MNAFPRTVVGGVSVSRMIIGTNWFLGFTHSTKSQSEYIQRTVTNRKSIAGIIEVFLRAGVDTIMCPHIATVIPEAIKDAQDRVGRPVIIVSTPMFTTTPTTPQDGFDMGEVARILDGEVAKGVTFCMPHMGTTDKMLDKCSRTLRQMDVLSAHIRQRGMIPGLSTHAPETVIYADETGLDVETYIQPLNLAGFLMQVEVDWIVSVIRKAAKPVMTIKPMAAGQVRPFQALTFVWNVIRQQDMVTVGTASPEEAAELIELSLGILQNRGQVTAAGSAPVEDPLKLNLQKTRSKATL